MVKGSVSEKGPGLKKKKLVHFFFGAKIGLVARCKKTPPPKPAKPARRAPRGPGGFFNANAVPAQAAAVPRANQSHLLCSWLWLSR